MIKTEHDRKMYGTRADEHDFMTINIYTYKNSSHCKYLVEIESHLFIECNKKATEEQ